MKRDAHLGLVMLLLAAPCSIAIAQSQDAQSLSRQDGVDQQEAATNEEGSRSEVRIPEYVASLSGTGLIAMDKVGEHLLLSISTGGGWDSNPANTSINRSATVYSISPYIGYKGASPKKRYIFQYQPTILGYMSALYSNQTLHRASGSITFDSSERWKWEISGGGSYGPNSTQLLVSPQSVAVGDVPGTNGGASAAYLSNSGNITYIAGSVNASYRESQRDTIEVSGSNSYSSISGYSQQGSVAGLKASYIRDISERLSVSGYGQASHFYGDLVCESSGVGVGMRWQSGEKTYLSLSAGPQISTRNCNNTRVGVTYSVAFSTKVTWKSQMYLLTDYMPTISYLGPGSWQRSASGGYQYQITKIGILGADAGYVSSNTLTTTTSYKGIFWTAHYGFYLPHGISVAYSYRGYITDNAGSSYNRNLAQFSVTWTRNAGPRSLTGY